MCCVVVKSVFDVFVKRTHLDDALLYPQNRKFEKGLLYVVVGGPGLALHWNARSVSTKFW